jgi:hypothetical protein
MAVGLLLAAARNEPEARKVLGKVAHTPTRVSGIVAAPLPAPKATQSPFHVVPGTGKR